MPWEAIAYVSSGITLAAFLGALAAWIYSKKSEEKARLIEVAPEAERALLVQDALEFFHVDTGGLTRDQRYQLAITQIKARADRFKASLVVVIIVAILAAAVSTYAISRIPASSNSAVEPMAMPIPTQPTTTPKIVPEEMSSIEESLPKLYLLSVGVNDYGHPAANRHSAVASAKAIAGLFAKQKGKAFSDVETVVLTESKATQANVLRALKSWAQKASNNDFAIAFFAGRAGVYPTDNTPGRYAFMCFGSDDHEPELTGISGKMILDLSADIAAPKLVIIDTPTYGGIHPQVARDATPSVEVQRLPALDILVASWNGEETESSFGQSSFSKTLLDGLNMAADGNQDDVVTYIELRSYIFSHGGSAGVTTPIQFRELNPQTVLMRTSL